MTTFDNNEYSDDSSVESYMTTMTDETSEKQIIFEETEPDLCLDDLESLFSQLEVTTPQVVEEKVSLFCFYFTQEFRNKVCEKRFFFFIFA